MFPARCSSTPLGHRAIHPIIEGSLLVPGSLSVGRLGETRRVAIIASISCVATSQRLDALVRSLANDVLHRFVQGARWLGLRAFSTSRGLIRRGRLLVNSVAPMAPVVLAVHANSSGAG